MKYLKIVILGSVLFFAGCSLHSEPMLTNNGVRSCLTAPPSESSYGGPRFEAYSLELFIGKLRYEWDVQLEVREEGTAALVGFSPLGNREFTVTAAHDSLSVDVHPLSRNAIAPEFLLLVFRLAFSPDQSVTRELDACGIRAEQVRAYEGREERVYQVPGAGNVHFLTLETNAGKRELYVHSLTPAFILSFRRSD